MDTRTALRWIVPAALAAASWSCAEPEAPGDASPTELANVVVGERAPVRLEPDDAMHAALATAGLPCNEVLSRMRLAESPSTWRILCDGGNVYLVEEEAGGALLVEPLPYGDMHGPAFTPER